MMRYPSGVARAALVICFHLALVSGCAIHLVTDYDDQIDAGLSQLNTDVTTFVNKMINVAGTPAGEYASNKDFYVTEEAKVDTLVVRAQAHRVLNSCPSTEVIAAAVKKFIPPVPAQPQGAGPLPVDPLTVLAGIKKDDCSVVLLTLVKTSLGQLEEFHKAQEHLGIPAVARDRILVGGLGSVIHTALTVEIALKSGKSVGGTNGT